VEKSARIVGIDLARGLAVVLMIQTHAFDGWVRPEERAGPAFQFTRLLGNLPLPLFLSLAGLSLGIQVRRAATTGTDARKLREGLLRSGARVLGWGYGLNILYAALDGARGLPTLLRFDVLHVIGLSIMLLAACVPVRTGRVDTRVFAWRSLAVAGLMLFCCPALTSLAHAAEGPLRYLWAPLAEVPGLSAMPLSPLAFFAGLFAAAGSHEALQHDRAVRPLLACALAIFCGNLGARLLSAMGVAISRESVGIWCNAVDLAGRAGLVTLALVLIAPRWQAAGTSVLARLGRHSLLVYAVHLPFCYGLFARPLKRSLSMAAASMWFLALLALCVGLAWLRSGGRRPAAA
jgi:uncharacterized membrane protein